MSNINNIRQRIYACWLGKNIGGTLGGPHEGKPGPLNLSYYDPVPTGVLPNDDLDLQLVWLHHLRTGGQTEVTVEVMAEAWIRHVRFPFDEYGIVQRNHAYGIRGPERGAFDNYFAESMGAAIRSELWACVAAGDPKRAAALAWADAAVDHCGEGINAEIFHAVLQSAAFADQDRDRLIALAIGYLPSDSRLRAGLVDTLKWWTELSDWRSVRDRIVNGYATGNFTDVVCNLCFEILGWMAGGGDFGKSICIAVNCGLDTDCTGATLGALLGILDPSCIPSEWKAPIGEGVVLSRGILDVVTPKDLNQLTDWTLELRDQLEASLVECGAVLPNSPRATFMSGAPVVAFEECAFSRSIAEINTDELNSLSWAAAPAFGHWQRWTAMDFEAEIKLLRINFEVQRDDELTLMAYYRSGVVAWVDGGSIISFSRSDFEADPFVAPSFHRAGLSSYRFPRGELAEGRHVLVMAFQKPRLGLVEDVVIGIGDSKTKFWLPFGFS